MVNIPYMDPMGNKTDNTVDGSEILHHLVNRLFSPLKKPRVFFQRGMFQTVAGKNSNRLVEMMKIQFFQPGK